MRALVVTLQTERTTRVREDQPEPARRPGELLVRGLVVGVCGTDREIVEGAYGEAPPHSDELVIGHESLGRVLECDDDGAFAPGDLVVGIVRRPDPLPCACCAAGEWDMCLNGNYVERGIRRADGYASERYVLESAFAIKVPASLGELGVLIEPASVVAKAHAGRLHLQQRGRARERPGIRHGQRESASLRARGGGVDASGSHMAFAAAHATRAALSLPGGAQAPAG